MKRSWQRTERILMGASIFFVIGVVVMLSYSFMFLSKELLHAFSNASQTETRKVQFDFNGFEALRLD
jgi:hypothetical protein